MAYIDFWRRWRDFSGKTSLGDYWEAILTHMFLSFFLIIVVVLIFVILVAGFDISAETTIYYMKIFLLVYEAIWAVPFLAMTVRRFRDAGYNKRNFWKLFIPWRGIFELLFGRSSTPKDEL